MFTGIVEQRARVGSVEEAGSGKRFTLLGVPDDGLTVGASIAVNGACLTVVEVVDGQVGLDVVSETLSRTNLGDLRPGDEVNIERAMLSSGRFDGHIVQGHVDTTGTVTSMEPGADGGSVLRISVPAPDHRYLVEKGSITVNGVSLTVASVSDDEFTVALIPHTLEITNLDALQVGDRVNLEFDVLAKYVERLLGVAR